MFLVWAIGEFLCLRPKFNKTWNDEFFIWRSQICYFWSRWIFFRGWFNDFSMQEKIFSNLIFKKNNFLSNVHTKKNSRLKKQIIFLHKFLRILIFFTTLLCIFFPEKNHLRKICLKNLQRYFVFLAKFSNKFFITNNSHSKFNEKKSPNPKVTKPFQGRSAAIAQTPFNKIV